jgi:hypothetical protein
MGGMMILKWMLKKTEYEDVDWIHPNKDMIEWQTQVM